MDAEKIEEIREYLLEEIVDMEKSIIQIKKTIQPIAPDQSLGRLTRMDAIGMKSINEAALRNAQNTLQNLRKGLSLLENEGFGICTKCGSEISVERLMVMPGCEICISCIKKLKGQ